jgi:hypothetical protein
MGIVVSVSAMYTPRMKRFLLRLFLFALFFAVATNTVLRW